jgi:hypothetical protein
VKIKQFLPLTLAVFLAACPGDSTSPGDTASFSFNYSGSGVGTGAFSASGTMPASASSLANHDAAGSARNPAHDSYDVVAVHARGSDKYDIAGIQTGRLTVGSTDLDAGCDPQTSNCAEVLFIKNGGFGAVTADQICALASGTVTISEVTATRLKGSFAGLGVCTDDQGQNPTSITVTSGSFDVAITSEIPHPPTP